MRFKDLLDEKFVGSLESQIGYIEIFENPSKSELRSIKSGSYRLGFTDTKNPKMYVWDSEVLHSTVLNKIKFDVNFWYIPNETFWESRPDTITNDKNFCGDFKTWDQIKNKDAILKKVQKIFPKVKYLKQYDKNLWYPEKPKGVK